jgi:transposase
MVLSSEKELSMSQKQFLVQLNDQERLRLQKIVRSGKDKARKITRCRILLLADETNGKTDEEISDALNVCLATIFNIRRRYCQEGLERSIGEGIRSGQPPKFKGRAAAKITAIACSTPPEGQARWSLRLLADRIVELKIVESISHQSVSNILKKMNLNLT